MIICENVAVFVSGLTDHPAEIEPLMAIEFLFVRKYLWVDSHPTIINRDMLEAHICETVF